MSAVLELQQREKLGDDLIYSFMVGKVGDAMGLPLASGLSSEAASVFDDVFGGSPLVSSLGWESGGKVGSKLWRWLTKKGGQAARVAKNAGGPLLVLTGAAGLAGLSYGGYVWLTSTDRDNARKVAAKAKLVEAAINSADPAARKKALDMVAGMAGPQIPTLGWVAIIAGIAVAGVYFWKK